MTIKTRNRINLFLTFMSLTIVIAAIIFTVFLQFTGHFAFPPDILRLPFSSFFLTKFDFRAVLIAINLFPAFCFIIFLYMNIEFENTQSTEIIYLSFFLIACLTETARLFFPFFNLWNSNVSLAVYSSNVVLFGRILAPLSLFFMTLFAKTESRQYIEQNIIILIVISAYIIMILPLDTTSPQVLGFFKCGYFMFFKYIRLLILIAAIITQTIFTAQDKNRQRFTIRLSLICAGYMILCNTYNFLMAALGATGIFIGTILYLKSIHSMYLWND